MGRYAGSGRPREATSRRSASRSASNEATASVAASSHTSPVAASHTGRSSVSSLARGSSFDRLLRPPTLRGEKSWMPSAISRIRRARKTKILNFFRHGNVAQFFYPPCL